MRYCNKPVLDLSPAEKIRQKNKLNWIKAQFKLKRQVYGYPISNHPFFLKEEWLSIDASNGNLKVDDGEGHITYLTFITLFGVDGKHPTNTAAATWDDRKPFTRAEDYADLILQCIGTH